MKSSLIVLFFIFITYSSYGEPSNEDPSFIGSYTLGANSMFNRDSAYDLFSVARDDQNYGEDILRHLTLNAPFTGFNQLSRNQKTEVVSRILEYAQKPRFEGLDDFISFLEALFSMPSQNLNLYDGINGGPEFGEANCKGLLSFWFKFSQLSFS